MDGHCDRSCNNKGCILDGLDCDTRTPELVSKNVCMFELIVENSFEKFKTGVSDCISLLK